MCQPKKIKKIIALILVAVVFIGSFSFLCSIRFRLDYYLLSFQIGYYYKFDEFDVNKQNFEVLVKEIQSFVSMTTDFYSNYKNYCYANSEGINFYTNENEYPNNIVMHKPNYDNWDEISTCLHSFPDRGFGEIELNEKYPKYVFFPCSEYSPRVIIYTGGERPRKIINEYWKNYEYVAVDKLADGWYDIRPEGKKQ